MVKYKRQLEVSITFSNFGLFQYSSNEWYNFFSFSKVFTGEKNIIPQNKKVLRLSF
jgi:hypothetical protein